MTTTESQRAMFSRILGSATGKTLRKGARGKTVRALQLFLRDQGIELKADGIFGNETARALREYQQRSGIGVDGVAGAQTFKSIRENITPMPNLRPRKPNPELSAIQPPAVPEPMPLEVTAQVPAGPVPSVSGTLDTVTDAAATAPAGQNMGMEFGDSFPPEAAQGYEMAQERLGQMPGNRDLNFPIQGYTSAHDELVRALTGRPEPGPPDIGMANSPLAMEQEYMPGMPYFDQANPGVDPNMAGLASAMRGQGMVPSGEASPQHLALIRALLAR